MSEAVSVAQSSPAPQQRQQAPSLLYSGLAVFAAVCGMFVTAVRAEGVNLDVPYVPTPQPVVDRMLQMAGVKSTDLVMDVGCGDGRMVVTAAKQYGARGFCNDIDPERISEARRNAKEAGVADKVKFRQGNLFDVDISQADVLPMYLLESINLKLRPKILATAKPGARVVSHAFTMGDWKPDMTDTVDGRHVFLWIVPARIDGHRQVRQGPEQTDLNLDIKQSYQEFTGKATINGRSSDIRDGRIRGTEISFTYEPQPGQPQTFRGRVNGQLIEASGDAGQPNLAKRP
ncbi:MAG: SAM-dependent methyltransferase [Actinomycetota bacterium]